MSSSRGSPANPLLRNAPRAARHPAPFPMPDPYVQDLLDGAWDVFAVLSARGRTRYVSPSNERILGYTPQDLIGTNGFDLVHPEDRPALEDALAQLQQAPDQPVTFTHRFRAADGRWRTLESTLHNKLDHPTIRGVVVHSHDITDRTELHAELHRAQQHLRRLQLHPHFVLNVLNTIQMQLLSDPDAAAETMARFGDLLRLSYAHVDTPMVRLEHEINFVERYVDLYRLRFPDRIRAEIDVPPSLRRHPVPSLLLQPVVENALRHGLLPADGGHLHIQAHRSEQDLHLMVRDDGVGLSAASEESGTGVGLSATRIRLQHLYGSRAHLHLEAVPGGGTLAHIKLPLKTPTESSPAPSSP